MNSALRARRPVQDRLQNRLQQRSEITRRSVRSPKPMSGDTPTSPRSVVELLPDDQLQPRDKRVGDRTVEIEHRCPVPVVPITSGYVTRKRVPDGDGRSRDTGAAHDKLAWRERGPKAALLAESNGRVRRR
jgi:hypothetical protein